jgi:hypothetical protein
MNFKKIGIIAALATSTALIALPAHATKIIAFKAAPVVVVKTAPVVVVRQAPVVVVKPVVGFTILGSVFGWLFGGFWC